MTVRTKAQFDAELPAAMMDNSSGTVSVADVRSQVQNLADSVPFSSDEAVALYTRNAANAGTLAAALSDGQVGYMAGLAYLKDSSSTGTASATNDLSVDGLVPSGAWQPGHFGSLQAMFTAAQGNAVEIYFPAGVYTIGTGLTFTTDAEFSIRGAGTGVTILQCETADGLVINQSSTVTTKRPGTITDLTFETDSAGAYTAIDYTGEDSSNLRPQLTIERVSFRGEDATTCWEYCIDLTDASNTRISTCQFFGSSSDIADMKEAIRLDDGTEVRVSNCEIYWAETGMYVSGTSEGVYFVKNSVVQCNKGYVCEVTDPGNLHYVMDNHFAANERGVVIGTDATTGANHSHVKSNLIFKNAASTSDFIAIECFGTRPEISGNEVLIPGGSAAGGTQVGIYLDEQADYARVIGNQIANMDTGLSIESGVLYPQIIGNTWLNNTANLSDSGSSGRSLIDGHHSISFTGYAATSIADVGNAINTADKYAGKCIYDATNDRLMVSEGSSAASPWTVVDGSVSVTPS